MYSGVRRLASMLDLDFSFPTTYKRSHRAVAYPECRIISLIVVVTKLSHPFDALERTPFNENDPTTVKIDWQKWREVMVPEGPRQMKAGDEIKTVGSNVLDMNDGNIDAYLDWYERTWIDDRDFKSITLLESVYKVFADHRKCLSRFLTYSQSRIFPLDPSMSHMEKIKSIFLRESRKP
jgi:hypothetical protein